MRVHDLEAGRFAAKPGYVEVTPSSEIKRIIELGERGILARHNPLMEFFRPQDAIEYSVSGLVLYGGLQEFSGVVSMPEIISGHKLNANEVRERFDGLRMKVLEDVCRRFSGAHQRGILIQNPRVCASVESFSEKFGGESNPGNPVRDIPYELHSLTYIIDAVPLISV